MRCRVLFFSNENDINLHPLYINTNSNIRHTTCTALENYIFATKMELCKIHFHKFRNNLNKAERAALISLRNEPSIIIKKADKSTTVVVQNRTNYVVEGLWQLNDGIHYAAVHEDNTQEIRNQIKKVVCVMHINSNNCSDFCHSHSHSAQVNYTFYQKQTESELLTLKTLKGQKPYGAEC